MVLQCNHFQETGPVGVAKNLTLEDLAEIMPDVATTLQVADL